MGDTYFYIEQIVQRAGITIAYDTAAEIADGADMRAKLALTYAGQCAVHGSQVLDTVKKQAIYNKPLDVERSEEHTSELQSLMRISYAVFCLKKKIKKIQ